MLIAWNISLSMGEYDVRRVTRRSMIDEYDKYQSSHSAITPEDKRLPTYAFWQKHSDKYPSLAPVAMWHAEMAISSVSAERAFALMRNFEAPNRRSMSPARFRAEMLLRYNADITMSLLGAHLVTMKDAGLIGSTSRPVFRLPMALIEVPFDVKPSDGKEPLPPLLPPDVENASDDPSDIAE